MKDFTITHIGDTELSLPMPFKFIKAKGETFQFQSHDGTEFGSKSKGIPITFADDFWLCTYQTTQELWQAIVKESKAKGLEEYPSLFKGKTRPVDQVSWGDVHFFNEIYNELLEEGKVKFVNDEVFNGNFCLPSETQWEYVANAKKGLAFSGSQNLNDVAWFSSNSNNQTMPVGLKRPNAFGMFDMSGNVWEWCEDDFNIELDVIPKDGTPYLKIDNHKSVRGGSFFYNARRCLLKNRGERHFDYRRERSGFRLKFSRT